MPQNQDADCLNKAATRVDDLPWAEHEKRATVAH